MPPLTPSLYDILGVKKTDSCSDIKKAFLKLARQHHLDRGGDQEKFKEIQRASEILTDEKKRKMYDNFGIIDNINSNNNSNITTTDFYSQFNNNTNHSVFSKENDPLYPFV